MTSKYYYHYTTEEGLEAIKKSKKIIASSKSVRNRDAVFGDGVYLTTLNPKTAKEKIAKNNYDGRDSVYLRNIGRVARVVKIKLPASKVQKCDDASRIVFLHEGDIDLTLYEHEFL